MNKVIMTTLGWSVLLSQPTTRDERGLSQSTENAILLAGAVIVGAIVIAVIKAYVEKNLPQ